MGLVFLEEEKRRRAVISLEQKNKGLAGFISGAENRDCWCGFSGAENRGILA